VTRRRVLAFAALGALALLLGVRAARRPNDGDLVVFYKVCARVGQGLDLYHHREGPDPGKPTAYIYPPPFAVLFYPLTLLPFALLRGLWCAVGVLAAARALWLALDLLPRPPPDTKLGLPLALGVLFWLRYAWSDLGHGQVNLLVAWLTLEGAHAVEGGRDLRGGAWLAAAITFKVTPAIVLAYYLTRRRWRVAQGAALVGALLLLSPALVFGFGTNLEYLWRFVSEVTGWNARFHAFVGNNAALPGLLARLLAGTGDAGQALRPLWGSLDPHSVLWGCRGVSALVLVATLGLAWRARGVRSLALVLAAVPLISPIAWKPHLVVLILPGMLAGRLLLVPGKHRWLLGGALVCAGLAGRATLGRELANAWILWGGTTLGLVLLWLGLVLAPDLEPSSVVLDEAQGGGVEPELGA
jgi:hypothetical protein